MEDTRTKEELINFLSSGGRAKYVFFWGHRKPKNNQASKSCFSQWFPAPFKIDDRDYPTAEHYMMAAKARLFGDMEIEQAVLAASNPGAAKKLGRQVRNFDNDVWEEKRFEIVVDANVAKFSQNKEMAEFLINTGDRVLVEARPVDKIWGIGLAEDHEHASNPYKWKGLNLLGFALMEARKNLKENK